MAAAQGGTTVRVWDEAAGGAVWMKEGLYVRRDGFWMRSGALCLVATVVLAASAAALADPAKDLRALTGAPSRVAWVRHLGDGKDIFTTTNDNRLMGFDTEDGKGEREILAADGNYHRPMITPAGSRLIYSNYTTGTVHVVNWDGSGHRELTAGAAAAIWRDPATRKEWVYVQTGKETGKESRKNPIRRYLIDDPKTNELVWDKTPTDPDNFQMSFDGRQACSLTPWPRFGLVDLSGATFTELGEGCCASMAPESAGMLFHLLGDHRHLMIYSPERQMKWRVSVNGAPGVDGYEIYHPRWSNRVQFLALCGPFRGQGGITAEIYVGKFNAAIEHVESWVRLTTNEKGDFYPDLWVSPVGAPAVRFTMSGVPVPIAPTGE